LHDQQQVLAHSFEAGISYVTNRIGTESTIRFSLTNALITRSAARILYLYLYLYLRGG